MPSCPVRLKPSPAPIAAALLIVFTTLAPPDAVAQSYARGTTLVSGGMWPGGSGVNVYGNGTPICNPNYVGGNSYTTYNATPYYTGEEYQCVRPCAGLNKSGTLEVFLTGMDTSNEPQLRDLGQQHNLGGLEQPRRKLELAV